MGSGDDREGRNFAFQFTKLLGHMMIGVLGRRICSTAFRECLLLVKHALVWIVASPLWVALAFLALGLWAVSDVSERKAFYEGSARTTGKVERFVCPKRGTCTAHIGVYLYGKRVEVEALKAPSPDFNTATVAEVAYRVNPSGHIDARLVESPYRAMNMVPMIVGFGSFLGWGFVTYLSVVTSTGWRKTMRRRARRLRND
jgi:hypothetical protein